jgi:hypothetical protein
MREEEPRNPRVLGVQPIAALSSGRSRCRRRSLTMSPTGSPHAFATSRTVRSTRRRFSASGFVENSALPDSSFSVRSFSSAARRPGRVEHQRTRPDLVVACRGSVDDPAGAVLMVEHVDMRQLIDAPSGRDRGPSRSSVTPIPSPGTCGRGASRSTRLAHAGAGIGYGSSPGSSHQAMRSRPNSSGGIARRSAAMHSTEIRRPLKISHAPVVTSNTPDMRSPARARTPAGGAAFDLKWPIRLRLWHLRPTVIW